MLLALPSFPEGDGMPGVLFDSPLEDPGRRDPERYLLVSPETWETDVQCQGTSGLFGAFG